MPSSSFVDFAARHKPRIEQRLMDLLEQYSSTTLRQAAQDDICQQLTQLVQRGGKRLRPLLCLLAYDGYGGSNSNAALQLAASQELLHTFLLIHDDIIDRDFQRWGGLNISGVYFERYSQSMTSPDALHYAQSQALLAGDICLTLANQTLLSSDFTPALRLQAMALQQAVIQQVLSGEIVETSYSHDQHLQQDQVLDMYRAKTASYSFGLPLQLGALTASAPQTESPILSQLADSLGVAFQLQDDLLGVYGDQIITGKSNQGDLREGKLTVLILKALELTSPADRRRLLAVLGTGQATATQLQIARDIISDCGAQTYVERLANDYTKAAQKQLLKTKLSVTAKARLKDLIDHIADRQH